jgi:hypothetical protein
MNANQETLTRRDTEKLGQAIDRLDSLSHALGLAMPAEFHLKQFREIIPELVKELKGGFVEATGENPWEGNPE